MTLIYQNVYIFEVCSKNYCCFCGSLCPRPPHPHPRSPFLPLPAPYPPASHLQAAGRSIIQTGVAREVVCPSHYVLSKATINAASRSCRVMDG